MTSQFSRSGATTGATKRFLNREGYQRNASFSHICKYAMPSDFADPLVSLA